MARLRFLIRLCVPVIVLLLGRAVAGGAIELDFSHGYVGPGSPNQNVGDLTFTVSVDGQGRVTVDASGSDPDPALYVDGFDGPAGTVDEATLFGTTFSIRIFGTGNLRIDNGGHGLCIQGGNAQRLDAADEAIRFSMGDAGWMLTPKSVRYANSTGGKMELNASAFAIQAGAGEVVPGPLVAAPEWTIASASDLDSQGFVLSGITFEVVKQLVRTVEIGTDLLQPDEVPMEGSSASFPLSLAEADRLVLGGAATILTLPGAGGTSVVSMGSAELVIDEGARWILDGANYTGNFAVGTRFELARYGSFSGTLSGIRHRHFALPPERNLRLVESGASLYFEVVAQSPIPGPNIILIYMDDMSAGHHFGFEGRNCLTPTIDRLASEGLVFSNAFAASTVCSPSRYSLLTGRWPSRNPSSAFMSRFPAGSLARFDNVGSELPTDGNNVAGWLQSMGYRTGFVGKSHIIDHALLNVSNWGGGGLISYPKDADPAQDATTNAAMRFNHRVIAQRHHARGFDFAGGVYLGNLKELYNDFLNRHHQEWLTQYALEFIEENRHQRFFLYMAPTVNHGPVHPDLRFSLRANRRYTGEGHIANPDFSFMPTRQQIVQEVVAAGKPEESARETWVDYSIEAILTKLRQHGLLEDTLIILTADHGHITQLESDPLWGKSSLFDAGMKVPLVMHWPNGIANPGRTVSGLVQNVDIATTLLALSGGEAPPTAVDGLSLAPVLGAEAGSPRSVVYSEIGYAKAVRTDDWKLIALRYPSSVLAQISAGFLWDDHQSGQPEHPRPYYISNSSLGDGPARSFPGYFDDLQLYAVGSDPREQRNVQASHAGVVVDMKKRLAGVADLIAERPFGEFTSQGSGPPPAIADLRWAFPELNRLEMSWPDVATNEVGYYVEQSVAGGPGTVLMELPTGSTEVGLAIPEGLEDARFAVVPYNAFGADASSATVDLLGPEAWRQRVFMGFGTGADDPGRDWSADPDGDGIPNLLEYAFALDPHAIDPAPRAEPSMQQSGTRHHLVLSLPWNERRQVEVIPHWSTDLINWVTNGPEVSLVRQDPDHVLVRANFPIEEVPVQFFHVHFQLQ